MLVIKMRLFGLLRALFRIELKSSTSKPSRVQILSGEFAGECGWCHEPRRLVGGDVVWPCIPVELDSGQHIHLQREQVIVSDGPSR